MAEAEQDIRLKHLTCSVDSERAQVLTWADKAVQPEWYGRSTEDVSRTGAVLNGLSTPMMTLDRQAMDNNLSVMAQWCRNAGVLLAPHGKTTMAPALWREQLLAGAWAISVANEAQLRVARGVGVPRVIVANLFLRPGGLAWLAGELNADANFEFFCWVDSVEAVRIMETALSSAGLKGKLSVFVELGSLHARTGVRNKADGLEVAEAVRASSTLTLAGVAGYEGAVAHGTDHEALMIVDSFLSEMLELHDMLQPLYEGVEPILCAGGSAYFDRVVAMLAQNSDQAETPYRVVLRSGAYVVHDDGYYRAATPSARGAGPTLKPAMNVWARVISLPEPGLALLDAGKRDVPYDEGLPEVQSLRRVSPDGSVSSLPLIGHSLVATNDQHAYVQMPSDSPLRIGDIVRLGLSHPCTAFDKWALIPVLDSASAEAPKVVDLIRTYF